jgi:hypothetical protein
LVFAILSSSFRLGAARLIPRCGRCKLALLPVLVILAGCGGAAHPQASHVVDGRGFRFEAPEGWTVTRRPGRVWASQGSELVQVATFRLLHPYTPELFDRVEVELATRMRAVAHQTDGRVIGSNVVRASGIRSHSYRVSSRDHVDQYTFVLRGPNEYQLLCRRTSSHDDDACRRLIGSFALT